MESFPDPFPEGKGSMGVPNSAGPVRMTALVFPFAEALGEPLLRKGSFSGTFSPRPFLRRSRRTVSDQVVGMGAEVRSSARRKKM